MRGGSLLNEPGAREAHTVADVEDQHSRQHLVWGGVHTLKSWGFPGHSLVLRLPANPDAGDSNQLNSNFHHAACKFLIILINNQYKKKTVGSVL